MVIGNLARCLCLSELDDFGVLLGNFVVDYFLLLVLSECGIFGCLCSFGLVWCEFVMS